MEDSKMVRKILKISFVISVLVLAGNPAIAEDQTPQSKNDSALLKSASQYMLQRQSRSGLWLKTKYPVAISSLVGMALLSQGSVPERTL